MLISYLLSYRTLVSDKKLIHLIDNKTVTAFNGYCKSISNLKGIEMDGLYVQFFASLSGILVVFCGGIHIGWSIFHLNIEGNKWALGITIDELRFAILSFFTGVGFILICISFMKDWFATKYWMLMSAFFMVINGIFFIAMPIDYGATVATRIIAGFGHGISHSVMLCYIGEIASAQYRGKLICLLTASITAGIAVFSVISMVTTNPVYVSEPAMHPNLALGIIILPLSTLAFVLAIFLAIESPINTLYRGNSESDAQKNLLNFRQRSAKTTIITDEFNDMKLLVLDSTVFSKCMITEGNFKPFQLALTLKLSNLLYYNYTMNLSKMLFMSLMFDVSLKDINWAPSILMLTKCVAALLAVFLIDVFPRRIQYTISSLTTGTFLLAFGIVLATYDSVEVWVAPFLFITAEVFNAIAMHPMPDILLSEIFPLKKKTLSINSILICEYVGHMIVYIIYFNVPSNLQSTYIKTIVFGSVIILKSFIGLLAIPDTRSKTHREVIDLLQKGH